MGSTMPSIQPITVQISHMVRPTGAITTNPVRNDPRSRAKSVRFGACGGGGGENGVFIGVFFFPIIPFQS